MGKDRIKKTSRFAVARQKNNNNKRIVVQIIYELGNENNKYLK